VSNISASVACFFDDMPND